MDSPEILNFFKSEHFERLTSVKVNLDFPDRTQVHALNDIQIDFFEKINLKQVVDQLFNKKIINPESQVYFLNRFVEDQDVYHEYSRSSNEWINHQAIYFDDQKVPNIYLKAQPYTNQRSYYNQTPALKTKIADSEEEFVKPALVSNRHFCDLESEFDLEERSESIKTTDSLQKQAPIIKLISHEVKKPDPVLSERIKDSISVDLSFLQNPLPKKEYDHRKDRNAERSIRQVRDLTEYRRKLYLRGVFDKTTGQWRKLSMAEASEVIKIPKRSIDDYDYFMRKAKEFGFDFEKNIDAGFGYLRKFVKRRLQELRVKNIINEDFLFE